jgi:hypothetical protein
VKPRNLIIFFALLQLCVALLTDSNTFTHEESMWHYIGRNWFRLGLTPYQGGIDNKSPLIFAVFGLSDILFGIDCWFPRILGVVVQSVGLYYLYKIAIKITADNSTMAATIATCIYGLSILWRTTGGKYVSFTETYAVTLMITAIYFYITAQGNKKLFIAGMLAGFAVGWRLSAVFSVLAVSEHALFKNRSALIPFFAGLLTCIVALLCLATLAGIQLNDLWLYMVAENLGSGSTTDHSFSWKLHSFLDTFFYSEMLLFYPLLAGWFLLRQRASLLTIWLVCEFMGIVVLGIYARPHLKTLLPSLSLISGITIAQLVQHYGISFNKVLIAVWLLFFPKVTEPLIALKRSIAGEKPPLELLLQGAVVRPNEQMEKAVGLWIKSNTSPGDKVLVAGFGARVQLFSERLSPTAYFNVTQTPLAILRFKQEVLKDKPALIAIPMFDDYKRYVSKELRSFIDSLAGEHYYYRGTQNGYGMFNRK